MKREADDGASLPKAYQKIDYEEEGEQCLVQIKAMKIRVKTYAPRSSRGDVDHQKAGYPHPV